MDLDEVLRGAAAAVEVDAGAGWARHTARVSSWRRRRRVTTGVATAAVLAATAVGVVALTGDGDPDEVRTQPGTSTTVPEATTSSPTTTVEVTRPAAFPATAVVSLEDGRVVVLDTLTGDVLRTLVTYASIDEPSPEPGCSACKPNYVTDIVLAEAGAIAHVSSCCEPASGDTRTYSTIDGTEVRGHADHEFVSVSPDGHTIVYGPYLRGLDEGAPEGHAYGTTWIDLDTVALLLVVLRDETMSGVWLVDIDGDRFRNARRLVPMQSLNHPFPYLATRRDGMLLWVEPGGVAHVVDPATGDEQTTFDLGGPVRDIAYDASRTWLLTCTEDRRLVWHGGGETGTIPGRCIAAGW